MCLDGASRAGAGLLSALPTSPIALYYAWVPMLPSDNATAAAQAAGRFQDRRAEHFWDGERDLARAIGAELRITTQESLGLATGDGLAWDVYLAYAKGDLAITRPRFWMHQLAVTHAPRLDPARWQRAVLDLVES